MAKFFAESIHHEPVDCTVALLSNENDLVTSTYSTSRSHAGTPGVAESIKKASYFSLTKAVLLRMGHP